MARERILERFNLQERLSHGVPPNPKGTP
jgi:hypothetical protein